MLKPETLDAALESVHTRFELRDEVLHKELESLSHNIEGQSTSDQLARYGVKLRLICERDMSDRAQIIWSSLRRAHEKSGEGKGVDLLNDLIAQTKELMRQESIRLAGTLSSYRKYITPLMSGSRRKDAEWLTKIRRMAMEKFQSDMEKYATGK